MKLEIFETGGKQYAELMDGKPVYVADDGKKIAFDAPGTRDTISRLNAEAKGHRERAERAEAALKPYEAIKDPAAALKAMELASNLDNKKLIDAGEAERVKAEIARGYDAKLAESEKRYSDLSGQYSAEKISNAIIGSKYVKDSLIITPDIVHSMFGRNFAIDGGKVVARDGSGNVIYSTARPGEHANADEALAVLVGSYANRDVIMRGANQSGGGSRAGGAAPGGAKVITNEQLAEIPAKDRPAFFAAGGTLTD